MGFDALGWAGVAVSAADSLFNRPSGGGASLKKQYKMQAEFGPDIAQQTAAQTIMGKVQGAREAGLHPLYAMGGGGAGPTFAMPGQSPSGSHKDLGASLMQMSQLQNQRERTSIDKKESASRLQNDELGRQLTQLRIDKIKNDAGNSPALVNTDPRSPYNLPNINPLVQEIKKGEVDTHMKKNPEQSLNVKSPMTRVRIGSQLVWVAVEELDEFMENPLLVGGLTVLYHGNKDVNWSQLWHEYRGRKLSPKEVTLGTQAMRSRMRTKTRAARTRSASAYKSRSHSHHYR